MHNVTKSFPQNSIDTCIYQKQYSQSGFSSGVRFLAPTGALVLMMVYYIYIYPRPLFQIFTQSIDAIDVTSVTLSHSKVAYVNMDDG